MLVDTSQREGTGLDAVAGSVRVMADPVGAKILDLLADEELCVCHLQAAPELRRTLVSHHTKVLRAAGLVEARDGRSPSLPPARPVGFAPAVGRVDPAGGRQHPSATNAAAAD